MYVQTLSLPKYNFNPAIAESPPSAHFLISCPPIAQSPQIMSNSNFKSGSCNLRNRVSESPKSLRTNGGLVSIRCDGSPVTDKEDKDDKFYIRRAVELARKAIGCTSPNPMVGCVIVKDGKIVGEGFHPKAGQPHAEVFAVRDAGDLAENATAYVSLEPCNHYGRTPPCTEALIKAKVKNVVVGMVDPNPIVASKGLDKLRDAGINVTAGVEEELCKKLNEAYIHQMLTGKPFVTLRYTLSVNGYLTDQLGEEAGASGGYYSQLLQEYDAIILSSSLLAHTPSLPASNEPGANQPLQIVIAKSPVSIIESTSKAIIFTDKEMSVGPKTAQQGTEMVVLERINLLDILEYCNGKKMCSVLLDLRGNIHDFQEILKEGFEENLLQKVVVEVLPIWGVVEKEGLPKALKNLGKGLRLKNLTSRISGESVLLEGYF